MKYFLVQYRIFKANDNHSIVPLAIIQGRGPMNNIDEIDNKILEAIRDRSTTKWVNSVNVKRALRLEKIVFRDHLARLKALGYVETQPASYPENHSDRDGESQIRLTNHGRNLIVRKR
jgi:hypothetical protein